MRAQAQPTSFFARHGRLLLGGGFALFVLLAATAWGGAASPGPLLYAGVAFVLLALLAFAALVWWLFISPLPARKAARQTAASTPLLRQTLAVLVSIAGGLFVVGAFWDELWHRQFGLPLGEDFWWRPHQLIYGSLALSALFALGGLAFVLRGRGDLRRRFRAEPAIGLLALVAGFQMLSVPIDPIWHQIYGVDITAWSLPHILLALVVSVVMMGAVGLQLSLVRPSGWGTMANASLQEILALLPIIMGTLMFTQLATAEWEGLTAIGRDTVVQGFWSRPEWLYPVVVLLVGTFFGAFTLHAVKRVGAASLVGIGVLGLRALMVGGWGAGDYGLSSQSHALIAMLLITMDLVYALRLRQADAPSTLLLASLTAALVMFTAGFAFIDTFMIYPRITLETIPGMLVFGVVMAIAGGSAGRAAGLWIGGLQRDDTPAVEAARIVRQALGAGLGLLAVVIAFVVWFAATAAPPIS